MEDIKNKKNLFHVYYFIAMITSYLTMRQLNRQMSESIRLIFYMLLFFSLVHNEKNIQKINFIFYKPWHKMMLLLLEFYITFSITGVYVLDSSVEYEMAYIDIVYVILSFIWVHPIALLLLEKILFIGNPQNIGKQKFNRSIRWQLVILMMIPCILFCIGFNPAITSSDSEYCFDLAHKIWETEVVMEDWQPPFYIFILNILIKIYDSVSFVIIIQCICFSLVFVDGILYFNEKGVSRKLLVIIYCFISFGISNLIQLSTLWKDIPYMISMMWLTILIIKFVLDKDLYQKKWSWYIQLVFASVFSALFRQNGILPVFVIIILFPLISKESKKVLLACIMSFILILLIKNPLYQAMGVLEAPQLKFFSLANDIMYSYYKGNTISDEAMDIVNKVTSNDPENFEYNAYFVNYKNSEPKGYSVIEFMKIYLENALRNPRDSIMAVLIRSSNIWSIVKPYDEVAGSVNYTGECISYTENVYPYRKVNRMTVFLTDICRAVTGNSVLYVIYWRTGIYNILIFSMLGIILIKIGIKDLIFYIMPFIPIVCNLFALFITSGWPEYRYFWPSMTISLLLLCYFILLKMSVNLDEGGKNVY